MDAKLKGKWVKALRSGDYKQAKYTLFDQDDNAYCCLGVLLCFIKNTKGNNITRAPSYSACDRALVTDIGQVKRLQRMNDGGEGFPEIADWIEANL